VEEGGAVGDCVGVRRRGWWLRARYIEILRCGPFDPQGKQDDKRSSPLASASWSNALPSFVRASRMTNAWS